MWCGRKIGLKRFGEFKKPYKNNYKGYL